MHFRVARKTAAMQASALAGIKDRFHTPVERPPGGIDWNAVMVEVRKTENDPVGRAALNFRLKKVMPQIIEQAQAAVEEQA